MIQQDKRHAEGTAQPIAPAKPSDPIAPVVMPAAPVPVPIAPASPAPVAPAPAKLAVAVPTVPATPPPAAPVPAPPEKKLKLAETPEAKPVPATASVPAGKPGPAPVPDKSGAAAFVSLSSSRGIPLVLLNRTLGAVVLLLIALVGYSIGDIRPGIAKDLERQISGAGNLPIRAMRVSEEAVLPVDSYLDKANSRNIFAPKLSTKDGGSAPVEAVGSPKDLKLVAVSMDSASASDSTAIIKNKTDSKTYFVKPGQTIGSTEYVLDKVFGDHVVIKLRRQEFELK